MIPRIQSDPGPPRLDPVWTERWPALPRPTKAVFRTIPRYTPCPPRPAPRQVSSDDNSSYITASESRYIGLESGRISRHTLSHSPASNISSQTPQISQISTYSPASISLEARSLGYLPQSSRKQRCWFTKIVMAPCDLLERGLVHCFAPSDNCMKGVQVTYWMVLIFGGTISAVTALAPHLKA